MTRPVGSKRTKRRKEKMQLCLISWSVGKLRSSLLTRYLTWPSWPVQKHAAEEFISCEGGHEACHQPTRAERRAIVRLTRISTATATATLLTGAGLVFLLIRLLSSIEAPGAIGCPSLDAALVAVG